MPEPEPTSGATSPLPVADSYLPRHGDIRYAVRNYDLSLDYRVATNHLTASATLTIEVLTDVADLALDLYGLHVSRVRVDGSTVKFTHRANRLTMRTTLLRGARARVEVSYAGKPRPMPGVHGDAGWEELTDGVLVGSQPHGAPSWFPCNDRPSDK